MDKNSKKLPLIVIIAGLVIGSQTKAFADDWLSSLFGSNNNNQNNNQNQNSGQLQQYQSDLSGISEALGRGQEAMTGYDQALQQDYQKLQQDQRAGVDLTADRQAIRDHEQALRNARQNYQSAAQAYQAKNNQIIQAGGSASQLPVPGPGYGGRDPRWNNRSRNDYSIRQPWQEHVQWQQQNVQQHPQNQYYHHHRHYDRDNDGDNR